MDTLRVIGGIVIALSGAVLLTGCVVVALAPCSVCVHAPAPMFGPPRLPDDCEESADGDDWETLRTRHVWVGSELAKGIPSDMKRGPWPTVAATCPDESMYSVALQLVAI